MNIKIFAASACLALGCSNIVSAGEAQQRWDGFYAGVHAGGGAGAHDTTILMDLYILPLNTHIDQSQKGPLGGGHAGFNVMSGPWLLGVEGTFSWTGINGHGHRNSAVIPAFTVHTDADVNWLASGVARIGHGSDKSLIYAKGGIALMSFDMRGYSTESGIYQGGGRLSDTAVGWTMGLGAEFALTRAWSVRLDYDYFDFGKERYNIAGTPLAFDMKQHVGHVGVSYAFNSTQ